MRIVRFSTTGGPATGVLVENEIAPLPLPPALERGQGGVLGFEREALDGFVAAALRRGARIPLEQVRLLAPVVRPSKIFAIGLNYADHIAESGIEAPAVPTVFAKFPSSLAGPHDDIHRPRASTHLDYEGELAVVIGRTCRHVPADRAHEVVGAYCVVNDVSVRDWQLQSPQWSVAKSFDTHTPIGPWLTLAGEVEADDLVLETRVNGELRQRSSTSNLVFDSASLIAHLSTACTLHPGDVIATGTPAGVGGAMDPPAYLVPGDTVTIEIEGLGAIVNPVVDEPLDSARIGDELLVAGPEVVG